MSWLTKILGGKKASTSAKTAKERLHVILQHERSTTTQDPEMLRKLQAEIMAVVAKYVKVDEDQVAVELGKRGDCSILELNVTFSQDQKAVNA